MQIELDRGSTVRGECQDRQDHVQELLKMKDLQGKH